MKKFKAALFDLDGVVFDTEPQYTEFWGSQCLEFHPDKPNLAKDIKGQTLTQIYDKYFSGELQDKQELITERLNDFERQMQFEYIRGFEKFISDLRYNGVKTAVVTSSNIPKMNSVYAIHQEFECLFDSILTAEDFAESKPSPDCYLKAAARLGVRTEECIVFEDSFNGLKSGQAAGMTIVGLSTTNAAAAIRPYSDIVISDYTDISFSKCNEMIESKG